MFSLFLALCVGLTYCAYFDPHNHISGILPWQAYANLASYKQGIPITRADRENLLNFLIKTHKTKPLVPFTTSTRLAYGSMALLQFFQGTDLSTLSDLVLDGILKRVLETSPFTEFDSAYKLRGTTLSGYTLPTTYSNDQDAYNNDLCLATLNELTNTQIGFSEQSLPFVGTFGNWGRAKTWLSCFASNLSPSYPNHRFLLQDLTTLYGAINSTHYMSFEATGKCAPTAYSSEQDFGRLLDGYRRALLSSPISEITDDTFWNLVVGMDFASPEVTCFQPLGMDFFYNVTIAMYETCMLRRKYGWPGKMVIHVHSGEGFAVYYTTPPTNPTFSNVFGSFPGYSDPKNAHTNVYAAQQNIAAVVKAIARLHEDISDLNCYIVFRLGHVTHLDYQTAQLMAALGIEADVNLDSNLITGAQHVPLDLNAVLASQLADPTYVQNFQLNDLSEVLIPDPTSVSQVSSVFRNSSLYYLLKAGVKVIMLGTDAAGTEQSPITREYAIASTLISYFSSIDPSIVSSATQIAENARHHMDLVSGKNSSQCSPRKFFS